MGDDAERAEDEYWADWGQYNPRNRARRAVEERLQAEAAQEEDWSHGGMVQRFPEGLTPEEIAERLTASLTPGERATLRYWDMTPEQRAGGVDGRLVAHRTSTDPTWNVGTTNPQEGRQMFAGDPDRRDHMLASAQAVERARQEREAIAEASKVKMAQWRRGQLTGRIRHVLEGTEDPRGGPEPEATQEELERLAEYATKRLAELKKRAQFPPEPDVTDGPCVVTFSRSFDSGRTSYTYAALRIPNGPSAGMWTTTGHRVRNVMTWDELMKFAAGPGERHDQVIVQVVTGWTLL